MYLYVLTSPLYEGLNLYKIGCTSNPEERLRSFHTASPPGKDYALEYKYIYKTDTNDARVLLVYERCLHTAFSEYRMSDSSEWFNIPRDISVPDIIKSMPFILSSTSICINDPSLYPHGCNMKHITKREVFTAGLSKKQEEVIGKIRAFISSDTKQGHVISPCGTGKTRMTCAAISQLNTFAICVPNSRIQEQWINALLPRVVIPIGGLGPTRKPPEGSSVVSTYMSSHLLIGMKPDIVVMDEAHHMAGDETGQTRQFFAYCLEAGIRVLSLTFTPRTFIPRNGIAGFSMNREDHFGKEVHRAGLREFIDAGLLPDYRIWLLDGGNKIESIARAWTEPRGLHHLIIFCFTQEESEMVEKGLSSLLPDTAIYRLVDGKKASEQIEAFREQKRAIIISCRIISEGVDVPEADSVAIMYPKYAKGDIVQMILRAGRWMLYKDFFHVLFPRIEGDDLSGFGRVLLALADYDTKLSDEMRARFGDRVISRSDGTMGVLPMPISVDTPSSIIRFGSQNIEMIDTYLCRAVGSSTPKVQYERAREINRVRGYPGRVEYMADPSRVIEDPEETFGKSWVSWTHFLHLNTPPSREEFIDICARNGVFSIREYIARIDEMIDLGLPKYPSQSYTGLIWPRPKGTGRMVHEGRDEEIASRSEVSSPCTL